MLKFRLYAYKFHIMLLESIVYVLIADMFVSICKYGRRINCVSKISHYRKYMASIFLVKITWKCLIAATIYVTSCTGQQQDIFSP